MTLTEMRYIVALARERHFGKAAEKRYDGGTFLPNLHLCGTDQGYVGVIGALVSGISMANRHVLQAG